MKILFKNKKLEEQVLQLDYFTLETDDGDRFDINRFCLNNGKESIRIMSIRDTLCLVPSSNSVIIFKFENQ